VAFDLLALEDRSLLDAPLHERHALLTELLAGSGRQVHLCPSTTDHAVAERWFVEFEGAGLDGVVGQTFGRLVHARQAHPGEGEAPAYGRLCGGRVTASTKTARASGSLLLGLHDDEGRLHHVGVTASFTVETPCRTARRTRAAARRRARGAPLARLGRGTGPRRWSPAGAQSRWNAGKDLSWVPIRAERVAEVTFGQLEKGRFRHGSSFLRWRPDRDPASCPLRPARSGRSGVVPRRRHRPHLAITDRSPTDSPTDHRPITDRSPTDHRPITDRSPTGDT
jgi:ATP-dependent DNA ligase